MKKTHKIIIQISLQTLCLINSYSASFLSPLPTQFVTSDRNSWSEDKYVQVMVPAVGGIKKTQFSCHHERVLKFLIQKKTWVSLSFSPVAQSFTKLRRCNYAGVSSACHCLLCSFICTHIPVCINICICTINKDKLFHRTLQEFQPLQFRHWQQI